MTYKDPTTPWEECGEERRGHLTHAWANGDLSYKLDDSQIDVYRDIKAKCATAETSADRVYYLDIGRRWGKDFLMGVLAAEVMTMNPEGRISYGAMSKDSVRDILTPIMRHVFSDCPPDMRPQLIESRKEWVHPNGCTIRMVGCNQDPDALRGPFVTAAFLTETAFYRRLGYVWDSVIMPMMMTSPEAFSVLGSSPPESPGHEWSTQFIPEGKVTGFYAHRTIEDNPRITDVQREAFIRKAGGREASKCQREYFAMHVVERSKAVIPEWQDVKAECVQEVERADYFDSYASMDPGHVDLWAVLFGWYDFLGARLIIEDEVVTRRATTSTLAERIHAAEKRLEYVAPRRYSDTAIQTICDLSEDHGLKFRPTAKDDKRTALNNVRLWVQEKRIVVHPRCRYLLAQLDHGVWKDNGNDYEKGNPNDPEDTMGHLDCLDALIYLVRNVNERRNPYPALGKGVTSASHVIPEDLGQSSQSKKLAKMAGRKFLRRGQGR